MRGKQTQVFTANQSVNWTVTGGTLSAASGASTTYTAPNRTGTYVLSASNGGNGADPATLVTITVTGVFPLPLVWDYDGESGMKVLIWVPQQGPWQGNIKRGMKEKINIQGGPRPAPEFPELKQFWADHYGREDFIIVHPDLGVDLTVRADSDLKWSWHFGLFKWSAVIVEA